MSHVIRISRTTSGGGGGGGIIPSGILYDRPELTGQLTSYRTGDDAWNLINGVYTYDGPINPLVKAQLDDQAVDPFRTLKSNNSFGNLNRFTDDAGGQTYSNKYVIDHLTGLGWFAVNRGGSGVVKTFNDAIDYAQGLTLLTYSDWRLTNSNELQSIRDFETSWDIDYAPFNGMGGNYSFMSSTTSPANTAFMLVIISSQSEVDTSSKAATFNFLICRNHFN